MARGGDPGRGLRTCAVAGLMGGLDGGTGGGSDPGGRRKAQLARSGLRMLPLSKPPRFPALAEVSLKGINILGAPEGRRAGLIGKAARPLHLDCLETLPYLRREDGT